VGDEIEFSELTMPDNKFRVGVVELMQFANFHDLYSSAPPAEFGGSSVDELTNSIYQYYSKEDEARYGVIGIRMKVI